MSSPTFLIKINNLDITGMINKYSVAPNKLFTNAGRDMSGNLHSTRIGTYPKITLGFRPLTESEINTVSTILDSSIITVVFWYYLTRSYMSTNFYAGDFDIGIMNLIYLKYEPFSVNLIPYKHI